MPRTADASSFTRYQKLNAQSIVTTKKPTQSSVPSATLVLNGTIGATLKATAVAAAVSPKTAAVSIATTIVNTKKRG